MVSIFVDSLCGVPENRIKKMYGDTVKVLPYLFTIKKRGEEEAREVLTSEMSAKEVWVRKGQGEDIKTSRPALNVWQSMIKAEFERGYDVLYIGSTSKMTGALQSVKVIGNLLKKDFLDRTLEVMDTGYAAIYQEELLLSLIGCINKMDTLKKAITDSIPHIEARVSTVSLKSFTDNNRLDLNNLKFKFPVIKMKDGLVEVDKEFDSQKEAIDYIMSLIPRPDNGIQNVTVSCAPDVFSTPEIEKEYFENEIFKDFGCKVEATVGEINSCMLTYLGEHSIGFAWRV